MPNRSIFDFSVFTAMPNCFAVLSSPHSFWASAATSSSRVRSAGRFLYPSGQRKEPAMATFAQWALAGPEVQPASAALIIADSTMTALLGP